jgi:hypothetical protein
MMVTYSHGSGGKRRQCHFGELQEVKKGFLGTAGAFNLGCAVAQVVRKSCREPHRQHEIHENILCGGRIHAAASGWRLRLRLLFRSTSNCG